MTTHVWPGHRFARQKHFVVHGMRKATNVPRGVSPLSPAEGQCTGQNTGANEGFTSNAARRIEDFLSLDGSKRGNRLYLATPIQRAPVGWDVPAANPPDANLKRLCPYA